MAFRAALGVDPEYADAHNNLGAILTLTGQLDEAETHYRRRPRSEPTTPIRTATRPDLWAKAQAAQAIDEFERALAIKPDAGAARRSGLVRAAAPDLSLRNGKEAHSCRARGRAHRTRRRRRLDILAAACRSRDFSRAIATAETALTLPTASPALAAPIRARLSISPAAAFP
jgi:tetratricopeptide (TPR) repeat protein